MRILLHVTVLFQMVSAPMGSHEQQYAVASWACWCPFWELDIILKTEDWEDMTPIPGWSFNFDIHAIQSSSAILLSAKNFKFKPHMNIVFYRLRNSFVWFFEIWFPNFLNIIQCIFPKESAGLSLIPPDADAGHRSLVVGGELLSCVGERQLSWRGAQMELSWRALALPAACGSPELNSRELSWRAQLFGSQMIRAQLGPLHAVCFPEHCSVSRSLSSAQLELCLEALPRKPSGRP